MPTVSIIIPNYNHEAFLTKRIESCLDQTYTDYEIIILDDHSTDNSREIIEKYRNNEKVSHIIYNEKNSGSTFKQWEKGLQIAAGKYIWIAESDDLADKSLLEVLVRPLEGDTSIVISFCRSAFIDMHDTVLGITRHTDALDRVKWTKDYIETGAAEVRNYLKYQNTIPNASAVLFRKPADISSYLDTDMSFCGDWVFWKRLLKGKTKIAYSHLVLNFFRTHPGTTRFFTTETNKIKELKRFREYRSLTPALYLNPLDNRCRWIMEEWINRGAIFKNSFYRYIPLLHPALALRYYLYLLKTLVAKKSDF